MKAAREARGWSLAEFSKQLQSGGLDHFHATTIARIEKGERQVRLDEAPIIAAAFFAKIEQMMLPPESFTTFLTYAGLVQEHLDSLDGLLDWAQRYEDNRADIEALVRCLKDDEGSGDNADVLSDAEYVVLANTLGSDQVDDLVGWSLTHADEIVRHIAPRTTREPRS